MPSAAYQFSFESNTQWTEYYCTGGEIQEYAKRTAHKYGAYKYIKFHTELIGATWNEDEGKWYVSLKDVRSGKVSLFAKYFFDIVTCETNQSLGIRPLKIHVTF